MMPATGRGENQFLCDSLRLAVIPDHDFMYFFYTGKSECLVSLCSVKGERREEHGAANICIQLY